MGRAALADVRIPWQRLGYEVNFRPWSRTSGQGFINGTTRTIDIFVKPEQNPLQLRVTIAHELGHALDFEHGSDQRRQQFQQVRGLDLEAAWFPCNGCDDLSSAAGDWAEVFAASMFGPADFRSRLSGPPSGEVLARLKELFRIPDDRL